MLAQDKQNLRDTCPSKLDFKFFSSPEYSFTLVSLPVKFPMFEFATCLLHKLTKFGSAVDKRTRNNLYVLEVYIFLFPEI